MSHLVGKCNIRTLWRLLVLLYLTTIRRSSTTLHSWQLQEWMCDSQCRWWPSLLGYGALLIANLLLTLWRQLMPSSSRQLKKNNSPSNFFPSPTLKMGTVGFWNVSNKLAINMASYSSCQNFYHSNTSIAVYSYNIYLCALLRL